jgi:serine/threonine protein kinase
MHREPTRRRSKVGPAVSTKLNASFKIKEVCLVASFLPTRVQNRDGNQKFVLKEIPRNNYEFCLEIYRKLGSCPYVRGLEDTAANHSIFVFKYLKENLLGLIQNNLPIATTKRILKDALRGLAALHDKDIVHNGIQVFRFQTARR